MLAFYSNNPSSNPTKVYKFIIVQNGLTITKKNEKDARNGPIKKTK